MDAIIISENGFASSTNILNLADQLKIKKMKKKEAEQVLQNLVQDKWLSEVIALSCRESGHFSSFDCSFILL